MSILPSHYLLSAELKQISPSEAAAYPFSIPAIKSITRLEFHPKVTFFVGENGSGKSTLLEALAVKSGFGPEGGTKNVQFSTADTISSLALRLTLARGPRRPSDGYFLRAESFYNVATYMDDVGYLTSYGGKSLHAQSHGESFMALLAKKFRGKGLYFLDEPEAALSPQRQLAALVAIHELVKSDSQFIIATHSPILLSYPNAIILQFSESGLAPVRYEDTEHYSVTHCFLNDYRRQLKYLLEQELIASPSPSSSGSPTQ
jgi:predicted ATPase